jgi:hypothetical protein
LFTRAWRRPVHRRKGESVSNFTRDYKILRKLWRPGKAASAVPRLIDWIPGKGKAMADIRQKLRQHGRQQLAAIARGDPDAPQVSAEEFRVGFERYVNEWLANTGQAHPGAPFKMDFTSEGPRHGPAGA